MDIEYQVISPENKRYRGIINKSNSVSKEEDVFNLLELQSGRVSYRDKKLVIFDHSHKAITLSLYLPKMIPDPKTKSEDGLKKFVVGKSKSSSKHVLRVRYHTGNWIFICFPGGLGSKQTDFLVDQYIRLRRKKMVTFGIRMGKRVEYNELKFYLIESYERMRCTYSKPRVFGMQDLPYKTYYAWVKFEKPGKKKKLKKKVTVQRRRSADYFKNETKFEGYLVDLGYDPAANLTVVSQSNAHGHMHIPSNYDNSGPGMVGAMGVTGRRREPIQEMNESMEEYNINDPLEPSDRSIPHERMKNPFVGTDSPNIRSRKSGSRGKSNPSVGFDFENGQIRKFSKYFKIHESKRMGTIDQLEQITEQPKNDRRRESTQIESVENTEGLKETNGPD